MTKKAKLVYTMLIAVCVLIMVGIGLMTYFMAKPGKEAQPIRLDLVDGFGQVLEFNEMTMAPGSECTYRLLLSSEDAGDYAVTLSFIEYGNRDLRKYAYVRIESGDKVICDKSLNTVFKEETYVVDLALSSDEYAEVLVTYYIPELEGTAGMEVSSDFELVVIANNAEDFYD